MLHSNPELRKKTTQACLEWIKTMLFNGTLPQEALPALFQYFNALAAIEEMHRRLNIENKPLLNHSDRKV